MTAWLWLLALAAAGLQAAALATQYFQPGLDGDVLFTQRFADDLLGGIYPPSGWTLPSAPFFFPDIAGTLLICQLGMSTAPAIPYYVIGAYVSLAVVAGWSLRAGGRTGWSAWLAGALLVNFLLTWRGLTDHARVLWWLGAPVFHGGAVQIGLAQFALWAGPTRLVPSRRRLLLAAVLMFLGAVSDTLLLTQFLLPLALALAISAGRSWRDEPRVRVFFVTLILVVAGAGLFQGLLGRANWGTFSNVVRYTPTPAAMAESAAQFGRDLAGDAGRNAGGFLIGSVVCAALAIWLGRRARGGGDTVPVERRQAAIFSTASVASAVLLPIFSVYWKNAQNARYLLPCFIMPGWWLLAVLPDFPTRLKRLGLAIVACGMVGAGAIAAIQARVQSWDWPYPPEVKRLDEFLAQEKLARGLADYWHANLLNQLSHGPIYLNQLRPDGRVQFWNNNAFRHFAADAPAGRLVSPVYRYIITNNLNEAALAQKFGEPARRVEVAGYKLWLYDEQGALRLSRQIDQEVKLFLKDRPGVERIHPHG